MSIVNTLDRRHRRMRHWPTATCRALAYLAHRPPQNFHAIATRLKSREGRAEAGPPRSGCAKSERMLITDFERLPRSSLTDRPNARRGRIIGIRAVAVCPESAGERKTEDGGSRRMAMANGLGGRYASRSRQPYEPNWNRTKEWPVSGSVAFLSSRIGQLRSAKCDQSGRYIRASARSVSRSSCQDLHIVSLSPIMS